MTVPSDLFLARLSNRTGLPTRQAVIAAIRTVSSVVRTAFVAAGIMLWIPVAGRPASAAQDTDIVLRVGNASVNRAEFDAQIRRMGLDPAVADEQSVRLQAVAVEQMIEQRLLKASLEDDRVVVEKAEIDAAIDRVRAQLAGRKIAFADFLQQSGTTEGQLRAQAALEIGVEKMIRRRLTPVVLAAAFETRRREFDGTMLRVSHVILRPDVGGGDDAVAECMSRAQGIRNLILQGELSFAAAARRWSAGPSRREDGDIGYIPRYGVAEEEFAKQVFTLARGDISKPFATSFGVHLVTVTDVKPGTVAPELVRQQVERAVAQQVLQERLAQLRKATAIEYAAGVPHFARPGEAANPTAAVIVADAVTREGG